MAYRLRRKGSLASELARVVTKEFEEARKEIGGRNNGRTEAVHEARKHVKKIRAVLHLLEKALADNFRTHDRRLKAVGHQLSSLRDVDAEAETMKTVRDHYPRLVTPSVFAGVCGGLAKQKRRTVARVHPDRLLQRVELELRRDARSMPRDVRRSGRYRALLAGLVRGYRRARTAMDAVIATPEDAGFHAWRRRVKDHWYHMRLLEELSVQAHARVGRLKRLETWLGDDHNLVILRTAIQNAPARFGDERSTALVLGCIAKFSTLLRRRALKLGQPLFARKPRMFRQSIDGWWRERGKRKK